LASACLMVLAIEVFTVPHIIRTESERTPLGLRGLLGLSSDFTRTLLGLFLAECSAKLKFLVLVQSADSPSKFLVKSEQSSES